MTTVTELHPAPGRLSRQDYRREREAIRKTYGDSSTEAAAKSDQALAKLFNRSGWTQEQLAEVEEKTQQWVAYRLRFGRFLDFTTPVVNSDIATFKLTEGRFRSFWERTDKAETNERIRFQAVIRLIEDSGLSARRRPQIGRDIVKRFADGKWHRLETIVRHVYPDDPQHVADTLRRMGSSGGIYNVKQERRQFGKSHEHRLFKKERTVGTDELNEKLAPLITELQEMSEHPSGTMSNGQVARIAGQLRKFLKEWRE